MRRNQLHRVTRRYLKHTLIVILAYIPMIWTQGCAKNPSNKISSVEQGTSSGVKTEDGSGEHHTESQGDSDANNSFSDQSTPVTSSTNSVNISELTDCSGNPVGEDRNALASVLFQKAFSVNSNESDFCELVNGQSDDSISLFFFLPDLCQEACVEDSLSLGLAVLRSSYKDLISLHIVFSNQNLTAYGDIQKLIEQYNLKVRLITQTEAEQTVFRKLQQLTNDLADLFVISTDLTIDAGSTTENQWLDMVRKAEVIHTQIYAEVNLSVEDPVTRLTGLDFLETGSIDFISVSPSPQNSDSEISP